jgi:3-oxoacyl-[acyl-carrier protein] reductase
VSGDPKLGPVKPLQGRVAVVTGGSRRVGIGFAIAHRLLSEGAAVALHSWSWHDAEQPWGADEQGVESLVEELRAGGGPVAHIEADFADPAAPEQVMASAEARLGHVDILVCNHARSSSLSLEELTATEIDLTFQVNARATLLLVKELARRHDGRGGGRVIMMTSGQHLSPMPGELPYIASKGAIHQLTASLAAHLAPRGITVNSINPGATDTGYADEKLIEEVLALEPQGRWGEPDDAARLIAWLCSDDARWITGQVINSTGGGP